MEMELQKAIAILEKNRFRPDEYYSRDRREMRLCYAQRSDHYEIRVTLTGNVFWELAMSPILQIKDLTKEQISKLAARLRSEIIHPHNARPEMIIGDTEREAPFDIAAHTCQGFKAEDLGFFLGWLC